MDLTCTTVANLAKGAPVSTPLPALSARFRFAAVPQAGWLRRWRLRSATVCYPAASAGARPAQRRSKAVERRSLHNGSPRRHSSAKRCWRATTSLTPPCLPPHYPQIRKSARIRRRKGLLQLQPRRGGVPPLPLRCERPRSGSSAWRPGGWLAGSGRRGASALQLAIFGAASSAGFSTKPQRLPCRLRGSW